MAIKRVKETTPLEQSIVLDTPIYSLSKKDGIIFGKVKEERLLAQQSHQRQSKKDLLYTGFVVILILIMLGIFYIQLHRA